MENARRFGIEPDAVVAPHRARDARKSPRALGFAGSALFRFVHPGEREQKRQLFWAPTIGRADENADGWELTPSQER